MSYESPNKTYGEIMGHIYGYSRVSTKEQSYDDQVEALEKAGCERIFADKASGKNTKRPGFQDLMSTLLKGDTVVICKLDRIGRNLQDLITIVDGFKDRGIGFRVLDTDKANIDTTTPNGKLMFTMFAAFAEYERELILERTAKGRESARAKGRLGGRKKKITQEKIDAVTKLAETMDIQDACKQLKISRQSYYRLRNN
jgi:DNA invertase Pin-like site-specific DNA recombinase